MKHVQIGGHTIKNYGEPFVIAEIGANHNGSMESAVKLIDEAKRNGAKSVKFQSWSKESLFSRQMYENNRQLEESIDRYSLSLNDLRELKRYSDKKNIIFSVSVFSKNEADFFTDLGVDYLKIASMDLNNYAFLEYVANKHIPLILSTGLSKMSEIFEAYERITKVHGKLILLHCISLYPPGESSTNLNNITMFMNNFDCPIGFSDHSLGISISLAAAAKGACVIEKHFTLDKGMEGWDHAISIDPGELNLLSNESKRISMALGNYRRTLSDDEAEMGKRFRRSIVAARKIQKGSRILKRDLEMKRPGIGIAPQYINQIIGKTAGKDIEKDILISWKDIK